MWFSAIIRLMIELKTEKGEAVELSKEKVLEELRKFKEIKDPGLRDRAAYMMTMRMSIPVILDLLHEFMGYKEIAAIVGVDSPKTVKRWSTGIRRPQNSSVGDSLRLAFRIGAVLYDSDNPTAVKTWLNTPNKALRDERPIEALKRRDLMGTPFHGREVLEIVKRA